MPKRRKSGGEDEFISDVNPSGAEVYEKGGRVLRARETCMCPVCGMYFSPTEIQTHAQACLYILTSTSTLFDNPLTIVTFFGTRSRCEEEEERSEFEC